MKKLFTTLLVCVLLTGCSLIPKKVEVGQKKVKAFPDASPKLEEAQKQAAQRAAFKAEETYEAAVVYQSPDEVVVPAQETRDLAVAVSTSVGPPLARWDKSTDALVKKLEHNVAVLDVEVEKFAKVNDKEVGKKIEGTGFLQIPYFVYIGGILVALFIGRIVLKDIIIAVSVANPAAGGIAGAALNTVESVVGAGVDEAEKLASSIKTLATDKLEPGLSKLVHEIIDQAKKVK